MAEPTEADPIDTAWRLVEDAWDDDEAHKRFLMLCSTASRLGEAGRRYRAIKESDPDRAARAEAQIDAVLALAMRDLAQLKTEPPKSGTKSVMFLIAFAVSASLVGGALWAMLQSF